MTYTDDERRQIGDAIRRARESRFNTKIAAYTAAKINSLTWDKIESGEPVRDHSLRQAIATLWPASDGGIETILRQPSASGSASLDLADIDDDALLAEVRRRMQRIVTPSRPIVPAPRDKVPGTGRSGSGGDKGAREPAKGTASRVASSAGARRGKTQGADLLRDADRQPG